MGMPVSYTGTDKDELEPALDIMDDNDGQTVDYDNALDMSIYGRAFRLFYHDEQGELNYKDLDPRNVIVVDNGAVKEKLTDAIYFSENITKDNTIQVRMWLYDEYEVEEYEFEFKADYLADSKTNITELTIPYKEVDIVTHNITDEEGKPKLPIIKIPNN
ncbi:phage portal protein, partial [Bacillus wiedmannii]|uniref:phage portal protein n=1 Tax=Bacillus wiedmannii TaxID=1890302 RepID=UPI00352A4BC3